MPATTKHIEFSNTFFVLNSLGKLELFEIFEDTNIATVTKWKTETKVKKILGKVLQRKAKN